MLHAYIRPISSVAVSGTTTMATLAEPKRPGLVYRDLPSPVAAVQIVLAWRRSVRLPIVRAFGECSTELIVGRTNAPSS